MSEPMRKLNPRPGSPGKASGSRSTAVCPYTGITIPECSCRRCSERQIRDHAPWLLEPPPGERRDPPRAA